MGIGGRLTLIVLSLLLVSIIGVTSLAFIVYRDSYSQAVLNRLQGIGTMNSQSFVDWLLARQDEMRYLAGLDAAREIDRERLNHLLQRIAESNGHYDTIFFVNPEGRGVVGVAYDGRARSMTAEEAGQFNVPDRAWFRQAIGGQDTFSQPVVSRATGNRVSTVAIPVRRQNEIVGVMRGAVQLDTLLQRLSGLERDPSTEIYLVDREGAPVTPAPSLAGLSGSLDTLAGFAIREGSSGVGRYRNAAGVPVIGSYVFIPMLGWGLVVETEQAVALAEVDSVFWMLCGLAFAALLITGILFKFVAKRSITRPLGVIIENLNSGASEVAAASGEVSSASQSLADGASEQAASLEEISASLEEVSSMTRRNADYARQTDSLTGESKRVMIKANESMARLTESMSEISKASEETSKIVKTIDEISFQTNLLALNAAVEAARAGEAGAGFAVVADEVRSLALRAADAARSTAALIEGTVLKVREGSAFVAATNEEFHQVAESTTKVSQLVSEIAAASHEQSQGVDEISKAMNDMDGVVQRNAAAAEQSAAASEELNAQADQMQVVVTHLIRLVEGGQVSPREKPLPHQMGRHGSWKKTGTAIAIRKQE